MANLNFYFASCVLLLTWSWRTSTGLPVRTPSAENCEQSSMLFKSLLLNITGLLVNEHVCHGITSDKTVMRNNETVLACAPTLTQNSGCTIKRDSPFSQSECLSNITKDLDQFAATLQSYLDPTTTLKDREKEVPLLSATLGIVKSLRKPIQNCSLMQNGGNYSSEEDAAPWGNNSYTNRQEMCKILRGFHTRTITINRALGYISSGDHRK